jgi:FAD/FMN-containing dehydrogenase
VRSRLQPPANLSAAMHQFLLRCREVVGDEFVISDHASMEGYVTDWRKRAVRSAIAVLLPASTDEAARLVTLCAEFTIPIVPQGGNTGLVLGSIPGETGHAVVMSTRRLNRIRRIDTDNNTMTVEAGCLLENIQQAALNCDRFFPLSLASEGSCTIGGNLSTNAGGTAVLRYGTTRDLCLGLEVVTPTGEVWNGLRALRKDNTGYALRDLYIGAEGSLGLITATVLKLYPAPRSKATAIVALASINNTLKLFHSAQAKCGSDLSAFEFMSDFCLRLVQKYQTPSIPIFKASYPQYALIELSSQDEDQIVQQKLSELLIQASQCGLIQNAAVASSEKHANMFWSLRENISAAQTKEGKNIKHDISLPLSAISQFIEQTDALLAKHFPGCQIVAFGHIGDGNLHYNVSAPSGMSEENFFSKQQEINHIVHDKTHAFFGSISAEHGLGELKREEILRYKSPLEIQLMRSIKRALDPKNLMNPGKVLEG